MGHRDFKHTGYGDDGEPPFRYVDQQRQEPKPQGSVGWLVTRILAGALTVTLVAFFSAQYFYSYCIR